MATATRALRAGRMQDLGLLAIRIGIGASVLLFHGWSKIAGGPGRWAAIGSSMGNLGIHVAPAVWGLAAALAETAGSALILLGIFVRPAAAALAFTMLVATIRHLNLPPDAAAAGWDGASHALELFAVYVGLILLGSGRFSLGRR
jgi:putative oxidoreductase